MHLLPREQEWLMIVVAADLARRRKERGPKLNHPERMIKSDLFIINKIDLASHVNASLEVMESDTKVIRGTKPFFFTNLQDNTGLDKVVDWLKKYALYNKKANFH